MSVVTKKKICDMCGKYLPGKFKNSADHPQKGCYTVKIVEKIFKEDTRTCLNKKRKLDICPDCMLEIRLHCVEGETYGKEEI